MRADRYMARGINNNRGGDFLGGGQAWSGLGDETYESMRAQCLFFPLGFKRSQYLDNMNVTCVVGKGVRE